MIIQSMVMTIRENGVRLRHVRLKKDCTLASELDVFWIGKLLAKKNGEETSLE